MVNIAGTIIGLLMLIFFGGRTLSDFGYRFTLKMPFFFGEISQKESVTVPPTTTISNSTGIFFVGNTLNNSTITTNQTDVVPEVPQVSTGSIVDPKAAIISVVPRNIIKNTIRPDISDYLITYDVFNTGATVADKVHITILFVSNNKVIGTETNEIYSRIAPGMSTNDRDPILTDWVNLMKFGTGNYLQIIVQYYDYAGQSHKYVTELQIQPGSTDPLNSVLVTKQEFSD